MNTYHPQRCRRLTANYHLTATRAAFTLVELLVVIAIIGILVGLTAAGIFPVLVRAKEATILAEMNQLEGAIEKFKTEYGFYPPSFSRIASGTDMAKYLNRISPNHQESTARLNAWWSEVGSQIKSNDGADLVFWLSGLCANKQFPLTNSSSAAIPNAYKDNNTAIQRIEFYEFKGPQLDVKSRVALYFQTAGPKVHFLYRDAASYTNANAYKDNATTFVNPKTFQLFTHGMDGKVGTIGDVKTVGPDGQDNLTNFAKGRISKYSARN